MIKDCDDKIEKIVETIKNNISEINERYRNGPALYFYQRLYYLRNNSESISSFLSNDYHIEILYATLVSWDMNARGAKLKNFDTFKANIFSCLDYLKELEKFEGNSNADLTRVISYLRCAYKKLNLMKTKSQLVSNSKFLHFLFPTMLMPMDRKNTLGYFYGNSNESLNKYIEIIELSHEIIRMPEDWKSCLDDKWNTTVPKMIDNAIILLVGKSVK